MTPPALKPGPNLDDPALLDRLRAGDGAAFVVVVEALAGRLLAVARRFLRNEADAQDALQEAFIQAHKALPKFEARSGLATWLHSITVRACLMRLRQQRAHSTAAIESLLPQFARDGHRRDPGPAWKREEGLEEDEKGIIRDCIDKLPADYRNVILLRDIQELDTSEAAAVLEVSEAVVKTRLHRARQALRTLLDPYFRNAK